MLITIVMAESMDEDFEFLKEKVIYFSTYGNSFPIKYIKSKHNYMKLILLVDY